MPYVRVLLSATVGDLLYPHPQWQALADAWRAFYPLRDEPQRQEIDRLVSSLPVMAELMAEHRPAALRGRRLADVMPLDERQPSRLLALHKEWREDVAVLARRPPTLVFAVLGQARAAGQLPPVRESRLLSTVLGAWAVRSSLDVVEREVPGGPARSPEYR